MTTFIGLDLAWTADKDSGICWFEGNTPADLTCTRLGAEVLNIDSLVDQVASVSGSVVVAIDAPVLYSSARWVESEIARRFWQYHASPHQAHAAVKQGRKAGIDLGAALAKRGFALDPASLLRGERDGRLVVEVYPHTIHVRLFDLSERIPYKPKRGRCVDSRRKAMHQYQEHLSRLLERETPGILHNPCVKRALLPETAAKARGKTLKRLDDTLDGLTCALAAWLLWKDPSAWELIGDLNGYMMVPRDQAASAAPRA